LQPRALQAVFLNAPLRNAEALLASGHDLQDAELRHVPCRDTRETSDLGRQRGRSHFVSFQNETNAEGSVVAEARFCHVHVPLLEDAKRQPSSREENGVERKKSDVVVDVNGRFRGLVHEDVSKPRCRTSPCHGGRKASASRSARYTDRWRPPVQPIATVT